MKKSLMIFFVLFMSNVLTTYAQNSYYYFYTPQQQKSNQTKNKHEVCEILNIDKNHFIIGTVIEFDEEDIEPTVIQGISFGKVDFRANIIYCYDKDLDRIYRFVKRNDYTIEALNHTAIFKKGQRLYAHISKSSTGQSFKAFLYPNDLVHSTYWKTGIREGIHRYIDRGNDKLIMYKNDKAIDSLIITEDSLALKSFLEKYH